MAISTLLKSPSAFVPVFMSLLALTVVLVSVMLFGVAHEADEGASAHLWQLLMAGQLPVVAFFALWWLPRAPRPAFTVLALQVLALLVAASPVYFLHL